MRIINLDAGLRFSREAKKALFFGYSVTKCKSKKGAVKKANKKMNCLKIINNTNKTKELNKKINLPKATISLEFKTHFRNLSEFFNS